MNYENLNGGREPAPRTRMYVGLREDVGETTVMRVDRDGVNRQRSALSPRFDLANHSPTGFEWGYGGSGPAQLALALVADATGDDDLAKRTYQQFKFAIVAGFKKDHWEISAANVADFCRGLVCEDGA